LDELEKITKDAQELIDSLGFVIDASAIVRDLSIVQKQVVEIAKALSEDTKVLILDEPTTVLTHMMHKNIYKPSEVENEGMSIIYISHHLDEIFRLQIALQCSKMELIPVVCLPKTLIRTMLLN
jgi:ribose transport system ATP-binding protein